MKMRLLESDVIAKLLRWVQPNANKAQGRVRTQHYESGRLQVRRPAWSVVEHL
jgi:hypothetical protein